MDHFLDGIAVGVFLRIPLPFLPMFRINDKAPIVAAGLVLLFAASMIHKNILDVIVDYVQFTRTFGSIIMFGLPLIALFVAMLRKKGGTRHA